MDTSRLLQHFSDYKDSGDSYFGSHKNLPKPPESSNEKLIERDISLTTIHSPLPNYMSHHLNHCLDNCTDRDLMTFIKWKAENNIAQFRLWMRIIASTYIPQIEQENVIINEWYYHLLNINKDISNINNINEDNNNNNNSENKDNQTNNDSASDEEEHYSISTELDMSPNKLPITKKNKKLLILDLNVIKKDNKSQKKKPEKEKESVPLILSNLLDLPSSWLLHLFSNYFSFNTLLTILPLVCHEFRTLCGDPNVWKSIKFPITVIRNIYNETQTQKNNPPTYININDTTTNNTDTDTDTDTKPRKESKDRMNVSIYVNFDMNYNTCYFQSFLIRSCRLLQIITFEGSIEENDWNAWNHIMKILGNHSLRQIKRHISNKNINMSDIAAYFAYKNKKNKYSASLSLNSNVVDTLFVRCRHISRRGYCWLQSLAYIPTIQHIHCAALSRSDDVVNMIYNFNNLKTLNVNILGPRHPNRNFHSHHRLALTNISHLIPSSVTEFAIPVSVQEDFVKECFSRMPLLENLDFFRLTTPHQNVDIDSWACCLSSDTIYHLANNCKNLKKCQLFVKCFKPKTPIWDSVKFLLANCKGIHMLTIGMTESETLNGLQKILPPADEAAANSTVEYDKLSKRYFDQLKKVPFLRKRFRKFKKKTMKFPKFTIMWCLLT